MQQKPILLAPLDPVHDIGLKIMKRSLDEAGFETILLPPDYKAGEIINTAMGNDVDTILISRTLGYGVADLLANFVDLAEAAGIRDKVKLAIGGMAVRPELAAELGFDAGFGPGTKPEELLAFIENKEYVPDKSSAVKEKSNLTEGYTYQYKHQGMERMLDQIVDSIMNWAEGKTSPAVKRAAIREKMLINQGEAENLELLSQYLGYSDEMVQDFYNDRKIPDKCRPLGQDEIDSLERYVEATKERMSAQKLQHVKDNPVVFIQYGTGCPFMDIAHIKTSEAWGADGAVHFDPSWAARTEGFLSGYLTHEQDGSIITLENLAQTKKHLQPSTIWQVRAHRGLNTPETVLLAGHLGADMTKINIVYGSLGAGTDPERMTVDAIAAIKYAAKFGMPFDIVTNEELCGVPAHKAFAGMLIVNHLARRLGASTVLQPLFCYSPEMMINGGMDDNYIDFNAAKIMALRQVIDAPIWPGAPIGFLTQDEDRVQSAMTTALHASLAASLNVDAISIASSDEAYSGGPIIASSRIDTLRATKEAFRFFGSAGIQPTVKAEEMVSTLVSGIEQVLQNVLDKGCFVQALYDGILGSKEDGAYPGRSGRGTITIE